MTIFHTLKYPITESFNVEDLERMPRILVDDWWDDMRITHTNMFENSRIAPSRYHIDTIRISEFMNTYVVNKYKLSYLKRLKDRIYSFEVYYTDDDPPQRRYEPI